MRFLALLIAFFTLEGFTFVKYNDYLVLKFGKKWPSEWQSGVQRDALAGVQRIVAANKERSPKHFVVGPSSSTPFYEATKSLPTDDRAKVVSLYSGSQVLPDAVRLIETMEVPDSTVTLVITPHKFANMWYDRTMIENHYLQGVAGKYMVPSPTLNALWDEYKKDRDIRGMVWTQPHWRLFQPFMPFAYYLTDLVDENVKRPISRLKPSSGKPAGNTPEVMASEYEGKISDKKLKEFRVWRDFSKTQFSESVEQSFKMLGVIADTAARRGVTLTVAEAPFPELEERELLPYLQEYRRKFDEFAAKHINVRVQQFDIDEQDNDQKYFSDYVHLNKEGEAFYKDFLLQPFARCRNQFDVAHLAGRELGNPPKISWSSKSVVRLHDSQIVRDDLLSQIKTKKYTYSSVDAAVDRANIGGLQLELRSFADILSAESVPEDLEYDPDKKTYNLQSEGAQFVNLRFVSKSSNLFGLLMKWQPSELVPGTVFRRQVFQHYATPFGWAFQPDDLAKIAKKVCVTSTALSPGHMWTLSENIPLPANVPNVTFSSPAPALAVQFTRIRTARKYAAESLTHANDGPTLQWLIAKTDSNASGSKIANAGLETAIDGVVAVHHLTTTHTIVSERHDHAWQLGSFAPHTIAVELADGRFRVLNISGAELIGLNFNAASQKLKLDLFSYHADERQAYGYDLTPSKVVIDNDVIHFFRNYRNQAITDIVPEREIRISVSEQHELSFPVWQPDGRLATFTFLEHADYQETATDPLIMYGNKERTIVEGQGVLGNQIPYTKTVFLKGEPLSFTTRDRQKNTIGITQPTVSSDNQFARDLLSYHKTGFVEIAAHQAGTTPFANQQSAPGEALGLLQEKFAGRIWTDHGGIASNISFNGWDFRQPQYYLIDDLDKYGIDYAWSGSDLSPGCWAEGAINRETTCEFNMLRDNSANPIVFDMPMLAPRMAALHSIKYFQTLITPITDIQLRSSTLASLLNERGATILHFYPGLSALNYTTIDGKKVASLNPEWNEGLQRLAKLRDEGLIHVAKVSDWLDYIQAMRATEIVRSADGTLSLKNNGKEIKGASIATIKLPRPGESGVCEVRYFAVDAPTGTTPVTENNLVRTLPCGTTSSQ